MASALRAKVPSSTVRSAVLWPREHGAWGLLFTPFLLGTGLAVRAGAEHWGAWASVLAAALALFLLRTPLEAIVRNGLVQTNEGAERRAAVRRIWLIGVAAVICSGLAFLLAPIVPLLLAGVLAVSGYVAGLRFGHALWEGGRH